MNCISESGTKGISQRGRQQTSLGRHQFYQLLTLPPDQFWEQIKAYLLVEPKTTSSSGRAELQPGRSQARQRKNSASLSAQARKAYNTAKNAVSPDLRGDLAVLDATLSALADSDKIKIWAWIAEAGELADARLRHLQNEVTSGNRSEQTLFWMRLIATFNTIQK